MQDRKFAIQCIQHCQCWEKTSTLPGSSPHRSVYSVTPPRMKGVHTASHYPTLDADGTAATDLEHGCLRDASTKWLLALTIYCSSATTNMQKKAGDLRAETNC